MLFIFLRLKTIGHLLMWDEAWNILSLRAFLANAKADPFYWGYFFHPPLYMIFAALLEPFKAGVDVRMELLSLVFSFATLVIICLISAKIGGWKYACLSALFLSCMPVSIGYDTWIKQDGLASALGYLAIFLLLKKAKPLFYAAALSFSLLSKENALFFLIATVCCIFLMEGRRGVKSILILIVTLFILTSWWYFFFSTMTGTVFTIYFSSQDKAWLNSSIYYIEKLIQDMGVPLLIFFIIGFAYIIYMAVRKKQYEWALPAIVVLSVYIPASFLIKCKTPWLCLSARPAMAMIAAAGAIYILRNFKLSKILPIFLIFLSIAVIHTGISFSYSKYHIGTYPNGWPGANASRELAAYLNKNMREGERLMITEFAYWQMETCPIFLYYWKGAPIEIIKDRKGADAIIKDIIKKKISWLVIVDTPEGEFNFHDMVKEMSDSSIGKPRVVGWSYVWDVRGLPNVYD